MIFWLSFADPEKPKGQHFLGVVLTEADSFMEAVGNTHRLGINPGGEVVGFPCDPENAAKLIPHDAMDRLLSRAELDSFEGWDCKTIDEGGT